MLSYKFNNKFTRLLTKIDKKKKEKKKKKKKKERSYFYNVIYKKFV
jgi:hypothetical protein